ncbi:MAG: hypothetical protein C5B50_19280 [Verrucomicrobia bacterium]|nr:MAG: hypothetical protein C5B50_19280 [Verrucomicrobiota bacterium]
MKNIPVFPKVMTKGSATATIYERQYEKDTKHGRRKYVEYRLAYYVGKERKLKTFADYESAKAAADEVLGDIRDGKPEPVALSGFDRDRFQRAEAAVLPTGIALDVAASHFAKAVEILGSDLVIEAAREYDKRHRNLQPRLVGEAVEEFITVQELRQKDGHLSAVHVNRQAARLRAFAEQIKINVASVTAQDIDRFLDGLMKPDGQRVGLRTRDNWADEITGFFEWAKVKKYVPFDFNETVSRLSSDRDKPIEVYEPEEMAALLAKAESDLAPALQSVPLLACALLRF